MMVNALIKKDDIY